MWWIWLLSAARADTCDRWSRPEIVAHHHDLGVESSGLAWSRTRAGVWFTHGDRNDPNELVAFDARQGLIERHPVQGGDNEDWEGLAAAPCPDRGDCIYIGDIGDNDGLRDSLRVLAVREPGPGETARVVRTWEAVFPDGPKDAEALLVHPCTGGILVVTKDDAGAAGVYRFPEDGSLLEEVGRFTLAGDSAASRRVTGGDFDADGDRVVIRTGDRLWEWRVDPAAPNAHWSEAPRLLATLAELQGESVSYGPDGGLWTTSEGIPTTVTRVACEDVLPSDHDCEAPQSGGCLCGSGTPSGGALVVGVAMLFLRRRKA